MPQGGFRPNAGRPSEKIDMGLPKRKRGRPTKAEQAERAAAEARYVAELTAMGANSPVLLPNTAPPAPAAAPQAGPTGKVVPYTPEMPADVTPKDYFLALMRDPRVSPERRDKAAAMAIAYVDAKPGEAKKGKKEQLQETAHALTGGSKFGPGRAPLSVVANGG